MAVGAAPVRGNLMQAREPPMGTWEHQHENTLWAGDSGEEGGEEGREPGGRLVRMHVWESCSLPPQLKS